MLRKIPLAAVGLTVGGILTVVGFYAYAVGMNTLNLAGFFYGIPLLLGGLALKASELKPVPYTVETSPKVQELRSQATITQEQLRKDVTRYRYGQEAHLDESLGKFGLSPTDEERPILVGLQEQSRDGAYTLVMEFYSPFFSLEEWQKRHEKIEKFFGPDINLEITEGEESKIDVSLIKKSS
ncbi:DUF2854 domain-containing protein [Pleurocapsa sp. FMAR1]|uniref:DUF2854 domain-containing protein n=1 Tax=Pleurocapsa sp. FMAR1 TaxID=3040204 RepID=UPI0029C81745|nr:DUF2854 domain-containing protein [Pleurocapsa sp. FMAR1]